MIFLVLLPASLSDLYYYKVSNVVICIGLTLGLLYRLEMEGILGLIPWVIGILVPFFLCFILYLFRMAGAADIKLFSVIGSLYSVKFCFKVMAVSLLIGGLLSIMKLIYCRNGYKRFSYFIRYMKRIVQTKRIEPYYVRSEQGEDGVIPFVVAISLAYMLCRL